MDARSRNAKECGQEGIIRKKTRHAGGGGYTRVIKRLTEDDDAASAREDRARAHRYIRRRGKFSGEEGGGKR